MFYPELDYLLESEDPSLTIETERLVAKIIDNNGLRREDSKPYFGKPVFGAFTHHFGYHGIRTLYDKTERRNVVAPFVAILNWQQAALAGIELDPVDDRATHGIPRGWPLVLRQCDDAVSVRLDPMPKAEFAYRLTIQPAVDAAGDALDFSIRFLFGKRADDRTPKFSSSWACYLAGWDGVAMHYVRKGDDASHQWATIGEPPKFVVGEPVGYVHDQKVFVPEDVALPLAYVRIGERAFVLMFSDRTVKPFVVNSGGHVFSSPVQNPALDFAWEIENYPLGESVGFDGRLIYTTFTSDEDLLRRYDEFRGHIQR
jgi:hypothetical protein